MDKTPAIVDNSKRYKNTTESRAPLAFNQY
jgi:hypothetical protein